MTDFDNPQTEKRLWVGKLVEINILTITALFFILTNIQNGSAKLLLLIAITLSVFSLFVAMAFFMVERKFCIAAVVGENKQKNEQWFYNNIDLVMYWLFFLESIFVLASIWMNFL